MAEKVNELFNSIEVVETIKLRKSQKIFLYILSQAEGPLTKAHLLRINRTTRPTSKLHGKGGTGNYDYIFVDAVGSHKIENRKRNETREGYLSLITLGYVDCYYLFIEEHRTPVYEITDEGRKAIEPIADEVFEKYFSPEETE